MVNVEAHNTKKESRMLISIGLNLGLCKLLGLLRLGEFK